MLHLIVVELRAVFTVLVAWLPLSHFSASLTPECQNAKEAKVCEYYGNIMYDFVAFPAVCLLLYVLVSFMMSGAPRSFGSGAYLGWSWKLERSMTYKVLVAVMCFMPFLNMLAVISEMFEHRIYEGRWFAKGVGGNLDATTLCRRLILPSVLLLAALFSLIFPEMPVHSWDHNKLKSVVLARSWGNLFCESNDMFGFKLIDALWKAESGKTETLQSFLRDPQDMAMVQSVCQEVKEV